VPAKAANFFPKPDNCSAGMAPMGLIPGGLQLEMAHHADTDKFGNELEKY
jgi:hypothetical protein